MKIVLTGTGIHDYSSLLNGNLDQKDIYGIAVVQFVESTSSGQEVMDSILSLIMPFPTDKASVNIMWLVKTEVTWYPLPLCLREGGKEIGRHKFENLSAR